MCTGMIDLKKAMTRITELEEEMTTLVEKNDDLKKKLKIFMGFPATGGEDEDCTCPENYIDTSPTYLLFQTLLPLFWTLTCMI